MRSIRDIRNKARRDLHALAKVPAIYISPLQNSQPRLIEVRLHTKVVHPGEPDRQREWATNAEVKPRVICFQNNLRTPRKGGIFSFAEFEAYKIELTEPIDGETITSVCIKLQKAETIGLPIPNLDQIFESIGDDNSEVIV